MKSSEIITAIKEVATSGIPKGAMVFLFGSQARGDAHKGSDWDLLVILNKNRIAPEDHDNYTYPFWELGWKIDAMIHPAIYTKQDWETKSDPIFRSNVEHDGIRLC